MKVINQGGHFNFYPKFQVFQDISRTFLALFKDVFAYFSPKIEKIYKIEEKFFRVKKNFQCKNYFSLFF